MLLTESAAREKWCPFARVVVEGEGDKIAAANRLPGSGGRDDPDMGWPSPRCVSTDCMSWRWAGWRNRTFGTVAPCPDPVERDGERLGYCGLAGKPDMGRVA